MKNALMILVVILSVTIFSGCTENQRTKILGGSMTVNLPVGEKLIIVTWKGSDLWYLTRPMHKGEKAENYLFREQSDFGVFQGTIIISEHSDPSLPDK